MLSVWCDFELIVHFKIIPDDIHVYHFKAEISNFGKQKVSTAPTGQCVDTYME